MRRTDRLAALREKKFDQHGITIEKGSWTDERKGESFNFTHAVYVGRQLIGYATSRRHALKRAHQTARNLGRTGKRR